MNFSMKKKPITIIFMLLVMLPICTSCIATRSSVQINKVEVGMTKTEIKKLLGSPEFKNGDLEGEQWGYHKMIGEIAGPEPVLFLVTFDKEGKVIAYDTVKEHHHPIR